MGQMRAVAGLELVVSLDFPPSFQMSLQLACVHGTRFHAWVAQAPEKDE